MPILHVYVDDETSARLNRIEQEEERTPEELAECAVAEAALSAFRHRSDDPAKPKT